MNYHGALFDLDGTLLNTLPDLADAANAMRLQLGLPALAADVIASYVGEGIEVLIRRALTSSLDAMPDNALLQQGRAIFYERYHLVNGDKTRIYPGVLEGLRAFSAQKLKMGLVTNKSTQFTLPLLERTGLAGFFEAVVCGDTCPKKKPDPQPVLHACQLLGTAAENTILVGDSVHDAVAARAAGLAVLLVPYGYSINKNVHHLEVDDIVPSIEAAASWVEQHQSA